MASEKQERLHVSKFTSLERGFMKSVISSFTSVSHNIISE